ncbi:serine/threonine protein phosphatase 2A 57 kDa regulatory subunit B' kappa isoform-like [Diospyros lotus]|uniref:serine/threonine protein phosphatase 2A 57 kDa regulatory subunit B' kappa isoform-like n=1 Tax=Diospyros lotus TaxID=55363 RepID=UPI0022581A9A|nr:serine/threonine protein phosphatase 2A 57 kDa regulatory subunit B' kappa isoform-like [Diospyros lotus]XP_052192591.1 serine/threonine protein phosphatase 2A 57 kDa regulatory subunit B' kappa isoform-like [Diospyros lotus]XP_052192592.1 serine/threonine protein phosphatase 2A 57 kDa regulatory subunit B' kappa isoform-like [Diospyros lotus]XP_052192593.1 serine/threonine protein phosphatase 2A 57 kDa regulatory subunit B' kappa isoform-like [Diospyros lotus]XP_052192595.1 serine/threonine
MRSFITKTLVEKSMLHSLDFTTFIPYGTPLCFGHVLQTLHHKYQPSSPFLPLFPHILVSLPTEHKKGGSVSRAIQGKLEKEEKGTMGAQRTTPKASPKRNSTTLQHLFELDSGHHFSNNTGKRSPAAFECEDEEILSLISSCTFTYTFTDPSESSSQQDLKRLKLIQLLSIIKISPKPLHTQILPPFFTMLSSNLFRPLPPTTPILCVLPDDEDLTATPAASWPHLQIIYDILLRVVTAMDAKVLKYHIDHSFLINLITLFQSEDPRERESLKNVFHRIYSKFTFHRSFMRKAMSDVFLQYIFETDKHCGIGELLEIWGTIINGFTVPLKEEHKLFLTRVLIPLHKPKGMQAYHRQLTYCVTQFMQKEPDLSGLTVRGVLRYWPVTNCQKEVVLIGELEELVENMDPEQYRKLALPLCTQITKCFNSWNSQVAERALYVWNNEQFVKMASQAMGDVFPVLVAGMEKNLKWHWSKSVKQLTENVRAMVEEMEPNLYSQCVERLESQDLRAHQEATKRAEKWVGIELAATRNGGQCPPQPHWICVSN